MLLQDIRAYHAIAEKTELTIPTSVVPIFEHLTRYFDVEFSVGKTFNPSIISIHQKPEIIYEGISRPLLYPKGMIGKYSNKKEIDYWFQGNKTIDREIILEPYKEFISWSERGRELPIKAWDEDYYKTLAKVKFSLCPDGSDKHIPTLIWTNRFFDSIMYKAIPIVETPVDIYDGYKYYLFNEPHRYREDWVEHNLDKLQEELCL